MPLYPYRCTLCEEQWDEQYSIHDAKDTPDTCKYCQGQDCIVRVYQSTPVHLKGTGFYRTDNR